MSEPGPAPEAVMIEEMRVAMRPKLSIREAARRADISDARWRQITKGYNQATKDVRVPVRAPDDTLARMAHVVGATPAQLIEAGRDEAAAELLRLIEEDTQRKSAEDSFFGRDRVQLTGTGTSEGSGGGIARYTSAAITSEQLAELVDARSLLQTAISMLAHAQDTEGRAVLVGARSTISGVITALDEELQRRGTRPPTFQHATQGATDADQPATDTPATTEGTQDEARPRQKTRQAHNLAERQRKPQDLTANAHPDGPDRWPDGEPVYDEHWDQWKAWQEAGAPAGAWEAFRAMEVQGAYDLAARFIPGPTDKERMTTAQDRAAEAPHAESGDDPA